MPIHQTSDIILLHQLIIMKHEERSDTLHNFFKDHHRYHPNQSRYRRRHSNHFPPSKNIHTVIRLQKMQKSSKT